MPSFGRRSAFFLAQVHVDLRRVAHATLDVGMDFAVTEGHRGQEAQEDFFHRGLTKVHFPHSKHNLEPSQATHFVPWPVDWDDLARFYHLAGLVRAVAQQLGVEVRWGGDWDGDFDLRDQSFMDLAHYELKWE